MPKNSVEQQNWAITVWNATHRTDAKTRVSILEDSKSRDSRQYNHVVRLLITLYKVVLTFGGFLMKS